MRADRGRNRQVFLDRVPSFSVCRTEDDADGRMADVIMAFNEQDEIGNTVCSAAAVLRSAGIAPFEIIVIRRRLDRRNR
jgi:hypothetical protein